MTKEELRAKEKEYKQKIKDVPDKYKPFWKRQLKDITKRLLK